MCGMSMWEDFTACRLAPPTSMSKTPIQVKRLHAVSVDVTQPKKQRTIGKLRLVLNGKTTREVDAAYEGGMSRAN